MAMMLDKKIRNMMVVASSGKRLCVGPVSVHLSVCLSRRSIAAGARQQQRPASYIAIWGTTRIATVVFLFLLASADEACMQDGKRMQAALGPVKTYVLKKTFRFLVF